MSDVNDLLGHLDRLEMHRAETGDPETQRRYRRYVIRGDAELLPMSRTAVYHEPLAVQMRDISRNGVGFLSSEPVTPQSLWRLGFFQRGYEIGSAGISVCHCGQVGPSVFLVGAEFVLGSGLLTQLGVDAVELERDDDDDDALPFLSPEKVA